MDVVADVCEIPVRLNRGDESMWKLVDESGYRDFSMGAEFIIREVRSVR